MLAAHDAVTTNSRKRNKRWASWSTRVGAPRAQLVWTSCWRRNARWNRATCWVGGNQGLRQGSMHEPIRSRSHHMLSGTANGVGPFHT